MEYNKVAASASGSAYQRTLLGGMLSLSCICSQESLITRRSSPFFNEPAKKTNSDIELEEDNAQQVCRIYVRKCIYETFLFKRSFSCNFRKLQLMTLISHNTQNNQPCSI